MRQSHTPWPKKNHLLFFLVSSNLLLSGCSVMYDAAGHGMVAFGEDRIMPYFMTTDDADVACAMGESMAPVIGAFGGVTDEFNTMLALSSGMCADLRAKQQELRYIRAIYNNNVTEALDARTAQKTFLALAAKRQWAGYEAIKRVHDVNGECPNFRNEAAQLFWMIGLLDGIQAVMADVASESKLGLPLDTVPIVLKGMKCLDNEKWWGLPQGVEAMTMILMPTEIPAGIDPAQLLEDAVKIGNDQGVRMVQMLQAALYAGKGDQDKLKSIIRSHVASKAEVSPIPGVKFLDEVSTMQIQLISDKIWTQATGYRTPYGKLGTFWDDKKAASSALDIDDLL